MSVRSFIDTNVLIYADASDAGEKQRRAASLVRSHMAAGSGVVSTQVLQEFVAAALRKLALPVDLIRERLDFFGGLTPWMISRALDIGVRWKIAFYDALIVQAAKQSGCTVLLTEDLQTRSAIAGVRIVDPFA